ncbi:hypothetical protein D6C90_09362 [Aureobasidium pullulans]|uniref:Metallo-dependent phosphatase n=1 Tax=Aureobasidium pullulans TaxID=5580 RepID=A0A4S9TFA1_AURPU|nr:hypothetical protein D6C90_09362 [Aureobasidium pullulans]
MYRQNNLPIPRRNIATTRFVLISDTYGYHPALPKGDVLCHARGLSNTGSIPELRKALDWIDKADFEVKIIIAGSKDFTLDEKYYQKHRRDSDKEFHDPAECIRLVATYPNIKYLHHQATTIHLKSGPKTTFKIFGSPLVPDHSEGAFGYNRSDDTTIERHWSNIPLNVDVVLTHTPAYNHRDASTKWQAAGCEGLRKALWQVRPRIAVCGRIAEARGAETVEWNLDLPLSPFLEKQTIQWTDPGANRMAMSLVNLTRAGGNPLHNDGAPGPRARGSDVFFSPAERAKPTAPSRVFEDYDEAPSSGVTTVSSFSDMTAHTVVPQDFWNAANTAYPPEPILDPQPIMSRLHHRNTAALNGRSGRQETLIVNASIVITNNLNRLSYNQPIVVDVELPVGDEAV